MTDLAALKIIEASRWRAMKISPHWQPAAAHVAARLVDSAAKARYVDVAGKTGVPWWIIAVIHEREASQSWAANLAQGDPYYRVSIHVPRGRGPFQNWSAAAIDALTNCSPFAAKWTDWTVGGALLLLEEYNGLGYARREHVSPYLWAGTDQYVSGKYISDGHYDPNAVDHQIGCCALLAQMMLLDTTIRWVEPIALVG